MPDLINQAVSAFSDLGDSVSIRYLFMPASRNMRSLAADEPTEHKHVLGDLSVLPAGAGWRGESWHPPSMKRIG